MLFYAASVFLGLLAGLVSMALFSHRDRRPWYLTLNIAGSVVVAFTLVANFTHGLPLISLPPPASSLAYLRGVGPGRQTPGHTQRRIREREGRPAPPDANAGPAEKWHAGTTRAVRSGRPGNARSHMARSMQDQDRASGVLCAGRAHRTQEQPPEPAQPAGADHEQSRALAALKQHMRCWALDGFHGKAIRPRVPERRLDGPVKNLMRGLLGVPLGARKRPHDGIRRILPRHHRGDRPTDTRNHARRPPERLDRQRRTIHAHNDPR